MWRVILSAAAVTLDALVLVLLAATVIASPQVRITASPPGAAPAEAPATAPADTGTASGSGLVLGAAIIGGALGLNMLAIGFGARLRLPSRRSAGDIAAEFS
ncbi:MAG: hypothetical protein ACHP84_03545 [Caulobacterales bacterium]